MKKIKYIVLSCLLASIFVSCELFQLDNYAAPAETIKGEVIDVATGDPVLTDGGNPNQGIRIRLQQWDWKETAIPSTFDIPCMRDGTYLNTKIFKGYYSIRADGPFIPLIRLNQKGDTIVNGLKYVEIQGVTEVKFEVQPFLKIEWVGNPTIDAASGKITASFKVTRAVSPADFKAAIEPMGGYSDAFLNVTDVNLYVSESAYVGNNESYPGNNTNPYSVAYKYSGNAFESLLGQTLTFTSNAVPKGRTVFIRVGARINYVTEGQARYNYNEAKRIDMPQ